MNNLKDKKKEEDFSISLKELPNWLKSEEGIRIKEKFKNLPNSIMLELTDEDKLKLFNYSKFPVIVYFDTENVTGKTIFSDGNCFIDKGKYNKIVLNGKSLKKNQKTIVEPNNFKLKDEIEKEDFFKWKKYIYPDLMREQLEIEKKVQELNYERNFPRFGSKPLNFNQDDDNLIIENEKFKNEKIEIEKLEELKNEENFKETDEEKLFKEVGKLRNYLIEYSFKIEFELTNSDDIKFEFKYNGKTKNKKYSDKEILIKIIYFKFFLEELKLNLKYKIFIYQNDLKLIQIEN